MNEASRREAFRASPLLMGFLSTLLEDLQHSEREEAFQDEREERDVGTIWGCPVATFTAARTICDAFYAAAPVEESDCSSDQLGSDLYMESVGHGVGFSDRDHGDLGYDDVAERLSAAVAGRLETYTGDDGAAWIVGRELDQAA